MASTKQALKQFQTITNGSMTGTAVITSAVTAIQFLDDIGFQFNFSGAPTGTFQIQVSADYNQDPEGNVLNAGNWIPVTLTYWNGSAFVTGTTVPTSVGSPIFIDLGLLSAPFIRAQYTNASSTGTLNAFVCGKSI